MSSKKMNFPTLESLEPVQLVLDEVDEALQNPKRTILDSAIPGLLMHTSIYAYSNTSSFKDLWNLGASAVKKIPFHNWWVQAIIGTAVAASASIWGVSKFLERNKIKQEKERSYKEALLKLDALNEEQKKEIKVLKELSDELHSLNVYLVSVINKNPMNNEAILKLDVKTEELEKEVNASEERKNYLDSLNIVVDTIINDLSEDLETK